ncbi:MAG: undecaprenyl-phosphate glucose phosphotransferase [Chloroflexota bacterium]
MTDLLRNAVEQPTEPAIVTAPQSPPRRAVWSGSSILRAILVLALIASDVAMSYLSFRVAYLARFRVDPRSAAEIPAPSVYLDSVVIVTACVMLAFALFRLYIPRRGLSRIDLLFSLSIAATGGFVAALAAITLTYRGLEMPRLVFVIWWLLAIGLLWTGRLLIDTIMRIVHSFNVDVARVLIVGAGESGQIVSEKIRHAPELGYRVVGFVDDGQPHELPSTRPVLGGLRDIVSLIREHHVSEIIIAAPHLDQRDVLEIVATSARERVNVKLFPDIVQIMSTEVTTSDLTGLPMVQIRDVALRGWNLAVKRAVDLAVSAIALVVLSPVLIGIALLVKLTSRDGPAFYVQERVGLDGRPFQLVKFRSMRVDAETATGPVWARPDDDRKTRLGGFMRRWSLDELPQLVNVLLGEMSLVGPRPERPHFVEQFSRVVPRYAERHNEKAGMTGWAQVNGLRGQTSIEERTKYDVFYVENWSLAFDIKILLKTVSAVFRDRNAY